MPILAKIVGVSESDIQKTFYALTGISIVEYVRRRRLSLAGYELQKGEYSVLEVALKYGYTSPDIYEGLSANAWYYTISGKEGWLPFEILWKNHLCINNQNNVKLSHRKYIS